MLLRVVFQSNQIQDICQECMFNLAVHRRGRTQRRTNIDLHQPRLEFIINQNIKAIQLEPTGPFFLRFGVDIKHDRLHTNTSLDDHILDLIEQLHHQIFTFYEFIPIES